MKISFNYFLNSILLQNCVKQMTYFFWWSEKKFYFVLKLVQYHPCQEFFCSTTFTKFLPTFENID
jgi:hypothetical protein